MEKIADSICSDIEQDDDQAWTAFYAAFAPVMRAYAVRRGCDEPDDAVQACPAHPRCKHAVALALRCANGIPEN